MNQGLDPLSTEIAKSVVGEATKELIRSASPIVKKWLGRFFQDHQPEAIARAEHNAMLFLADLAHRLDELEEKLSSNDLQQRRNFANSLSDPDFSATLKDAVLAAARTSEREKHALLSDLIGDRLQAQPESVRSLTTSLAIKTIPHLSRHQLGVLGLGVLINGVRLPAESLSNDENEKRSILKNWWVQSLSPYLPDLKTSRLDRAHLAGLSCVTLQSFLVAELKEALIANIPAQSDWGVDEFLTTTLGKSLQEVWSNVLMGCNLTTIGQLIGLHVHSAKSGTHINVSNWDFSQ